MKKSRLKYVLRWLRKETFMPIKEAHAKALLETEIISQAEYDELMK